jgi:hypothetical protein
VNEIVLFLVGFAACAVLYHYAILPHTIDRRAGDLWMMRYSHADVGMIPTDEMKWTLHYLKA